MTLEEIRGLLEKTTPGPWSAKPAPEIKGHDIDTADGGYLASVPSRRFEPRPYDAALIAAAPDLASLLVRAVEEMRVLVGRCACEDHDACLVCTPARSLLRELGVSV